LHFLKETRPDWVIAQHEFLVASLVYRALNRKTKAISHFMDYQAERRYVSIIKQMSHLIDVHVELCDMRLQWRQKDWPRMRADTFTIRQAPFRQDVDIPESHTGLARVVFTNSKYVLGLNRDRLSRFLS